MSCKIQFWSGIPGVRKGAAGVALTLLILLVPAIMATQSAQAQSFTFQSVYSFTGVNSTSPTLSDGASPYGGLVIDSLGNLYGTTSVGGNTACRPARGPSGCGTVFEISPISGGGWTESLLYSFTNDSTINSTTGTTCYDGAIPNGGLALTANGSLVGTTSAGGDNFEGTVFEVSTNPPVLNNEPCYSSNSNPAWTEVPLTSFDNVVNGASPQGALTLDSKGDMFGTNNNTVFEVDPVGRFTTLYNFSLNPFDSQGNVNGTSPGAGLALVGKDLYGTTLNGGNNGLGTAFQLAPDNSSPYYIETGIIQFGSGDQFGNTDGALPYSGLAGKGGTAMSSFYGTTNAGGNNNYGTVYETDENGDETVLYSFCSLPNCTDGALPIGGVVRDKKGNFYGTTTAGGAYGFGTVFMVSPVSVANDQYTETVLYSFTGGTDGAGPTSGLVQDTADNLWGTTYSGGNSAGTYCHAIYGCGTVFEMVYSSSIPTTTTLISSNPSLTYGQSTTFTATVAQEGSTKVPTGKVTFNQNGTTPLKTVSVKGGVATYTTSTLAVNTTSITATYSPSGVFTGSSATVSQTVSQASTTTSLVSSANPSTSGESVTFTATVVAQYGGTLSGTMTFYDGTTLLETKTVTSTGVVTYKTSTLAGGGVTHNITAVYSGTTNGDIAGSTSPVLPQVVN